MDPYRQEKIDNAICFFAVEHKRRTSRFLDQTSLYKYLSFFDFETCEERGKPALGLIYRAMQWGPVPPEIYEARRTLKTDCFAFVVKRDDYTGKEKIYVVGNGTPDLDYFSEYEKEKLKRIIEIFATPSIRASLRSDASHERIKAWKKTWAKERNAVIDYSLTFDDDLKTRKPEELSFAERCFLTSEALAKAGT